MVAYLFEIEFFFLPMAKSFISTLFQNGMLDLNNFCLAFRNNTISQLLEELHRTIKCQMWVEIDMQSILGAKMLAYESQGSRKVISVISGLHPN